MKTRPNTSYTETPIRVAILIDGGYFIKRYNAMYNKSGKKTALTIANDLYTISHSHVGKIIIYIAFFIMIVYHSPKRYIILSLINA